MNRSLAKHEYNGYRLQILPELINSEFLRRCCQATLSEDGDCRRVHSSALAKVFSFNYNNQQYFHKTFCPRNSIESVKSFIRGSRAARSLKGHTLLVENGFHAPQVVLVGHKKRHNFMVTAAVPQCTPLTDFLRNTAGWNPRTFFKHKKHQIEQLGKLIGKMHAANIIHGDLLCGNLLLAGDDDQYQVYFIDNERTKHYPILTAKARLKNLVQLNMFRCASITKTDRLRFFKHYLRQNPEMASIKKRWIKKAVDKTTWRIDKKTRKRKIQ